MRIAFKINLLFAGIVCGILLIMSVLVFNLSRENIRRDFRLRIKGRAERAAYLYGFLRDDTTNLLKSLDSNSPPLLFNRNIGIYNTRGEELYEYHDPNLSEMKPEPEWLEKARTEKSYFVTRGKKVIGTIQADNNLLVMVSAEDVAGRAYINDLRRVFLIYFPVAVIVTLLAGFLFSRTIIRPIKQTIHDVKLITSRNLSHRLYTGKGRDELAQLNETFNALLNRLEESFAMEKRFISNASHELSTPLTSISNQIDVAMLQERSSAEYRKVLGSVLADVRGLHHLVHNLLEIARAGTHGDISLEKLRIDEILIKTHSDILHQYPEFKVELDFPDLPEDENECMVFGNTHLLQSAFKNIIENGCKYSPDGKTRIELEFRGELVLIKFSNRSELIDPEELEKLFEPFYRSKNAGSKPGVGLGLTLTRRIIGLHKGRLSIRSDQDGKTLLTIELPTLK